MKKFLKNTLVRYVLLGILALVFGLNIYAFNATRLTGNQVPMPFGYGASVVLSGSMEPTISVGDLILIREEEDYVPGDIVVYQTGSLSVVHRLVSIEEGSVITRGDANNVEDEPFPLELLKGKVFAVVPKVGYGIWVLKSPIGILVTLALAILLVEMSFRGDKKQKEDEREQLKEEIRKLAEELKKDMEAKKDMEVSNQTDEQSNR